MGEVDDKYAWNEHSERLDAIRFSGAPHVVLKPDFGRDGNQWFFLFGENLAEGVAGFGDTPELAAAAFDKAWRTQTIPIPAEKEKEE
jgi:hypothetical protein